MQVWFSEEDNMPVMGGPGGGGRPGQNLLLAEQGLMGLGVGQGQGQALGTSIFSPALSATLFFWPRHSKISLALPCLHQ